MKKLFLVCSAHLDPVWLWEWEEGAAAALATFRTAVDFCEEYDGFVFCHNEALLYQWVEEYDMPLFKRIQTLVAKGRWNIMGGWFLQPDCVMSSGESILRQIMTGQEYFREKFQVEPKVAVNFDTFGHDRGMVQILKQCGYQGYVFMRPEKWRMELPDRNFYWEGTDGSKILTHRLDRSYATPMGQTRSALEEWTDVEKDEPVSLFTWGVGNHGGGPSRIDIEQVNKWLAEHPETEAGHNTLEAFFQALREETDNYPTVSHHLQPVNVGCYTSQAKIKALHRRLENELFSVEKLLSNAFAQGLLNYPADELTQAQRDLLLSEFHDILPGTSIQTAEAASERMMLHGLEIIARVRARGFMAMLTGQEKAKDGQIPVFVYNPHPYPVDTIIECEIMPADQNLSDTQWNKVTVYCDGKVIPSQEEKELCNINLDWRKRVVFRAILEPSAMNRFDCEMHMEPRKVRNQQQIEDEVFVFQNDEMLLEINTKTGLVDRYCVGGIDYLQKGSFASVVFKDNADPWYMQDNRFQEKEGRFLLMDENEGCNYTGVSEEISSVRIVENGPVRTVVEAVFHWNHSFLIQTYRLPKQGKEFEIEQRFYWNERDVMLKLEIPTAISDGDYLGQGMFGHDRLFEDGRECVSKKWCGIFGEKQALTIANSSTYGSHFENGTIYLSLLRSPAYSAHPIEGRPTILLDRFIPRSSQGEHILKFYVSSGETAERKANINLEAQIHNEVPYALNVFPSGSGEKLDSFIRISNKRILLSAMYRDKTSGKLVVRLWNSSEEEEHTILEFRPWSLREEVKLKKFRFQTFIIDKEARIIITN